MDSRLTSENFLALIGRWGCPVKLKISTMLQLQAFELVDKFKCNTEIEVCEALSRDVDPDNICKCEWAAVYDTGIIEADGSNF